MNERVAGLRSGAKDQTERLIPIPLDLTGGVFMKAKLEINSATLRVFSQNAVFGDPFEFALVVVGDETTAIIKGVRLEDDQKLTAGHRSAIMRCLMDHGFTRAVWHRWKRGPEGLEKRTFVIDTDVSAQDAPERASSREGPPMRITVNREQPRPAHAVDRSEERMRMGAD